MSGIGSGLNSLNKRNIHTILVNLLTTHPQTLNNGKLVTTLS